MGVGNNSEKMQERLARLHGQRARARQISIIQQYSKEIPVDDIYAAITLAGGEAHIDDVASILKNQFGYNIQDNEDLEIYLTALANVKSKFDMNTDEDYWYIDKTFFNAMRKNKEMREKLENAMRKAMGYKQKPAESGLEALFSTDQAAKELDLYTK